MKRTITTLALLAGAFAVHAQGTLSFANYGSGESSYVYVYYKPSVTSPTSTALGGSAAGVTPTLSNYGSLVGNGTDWTIALYGAPGGGDSANALSLLPGATTTFANGTGDPTAGTWFSQAIIGVPGTAGNGSVATIQLYAWYNEGGLITSYAQALADNVPTGFSGTANITLGGPPATPANLPLGALGDFNVIAPTPEPSTIALGVIGASTFLMRLRRKQ